MLDTKDAYKILGLPEGSSKDEVIKRYDVLVKKHRNGYKEDGIGIEEVDNAYNTIMGYDMSGRKDMKPKEPNKFSKLLGKITKIDERSIENFFHYHKVHIIVTIIALGFLYSLIHGIVTKVDPDFYLTSIGEIYIQDTEKLSSTLKDIIPDLNAPQIDPLFMSEKDQGQQAYAMQMKSMTMLAAGEMDVILVDKANYEKFATQEAFENIDYLESILGLKLERKEELKITPEGKSEDIFGIDITNTKFVKENNIQGKEIIAAIRVKAKHTDKSVALLKYILSDKK